jgi:hypothetical protein
MLSFGVFDMARLFQSWVTVQHASRESARFAITGRYDCDGSVSGRDACIIWTAKNATGGLSRGGVNGINVSVSTEAWDYTCDPLTGCSWPDPSVQGATGQQCDQIEVAVAYKHQFVLPIMDAIAPGGVTVVGRQRMTVEPYASCEGGDGTSGGATATPPPAGTATPGPTATPMPTSTPAPTATPMPTATPVPTNTPAPSPTPSGCEWWQWWC